MDLKAVGVCYNSIYIFMNSSPSCHSKSRHVGKHQRARLKPIFKRCVCIGRVYRVHQNFEPPVSPLNSAQGRRRTWNPAWEKKMVRYRHWGRYPV